MHTAGEDKNLLDPFLPEDPDDVARLKEVQNSIHEAFIRHVKARRGDRLADEDLFTGKFWVGDAAIERGLVDGIGHLVPKMKEVLGEKVRFRRHARRRQFLGSLGARFTESAIEALEDRMFRARFDLW